jgi:hypothetical protein
LHPLSPTSEFKELTSVMTTRTLTHSVAGPVTFEAGTFAAGIEVHVTDTTHATVTVSTPDTDGASHQAVAGARIEQRSGSLLVDVRDQDANGGITIVGRGNSVSISAVSVARNVSIIGGRVFMDGAEVTGTLTRRGPVMVRAELPRGSSIQVLTESGEITTCGPLHVAGARTVSGAVRIEHAKSASATTTSGSIEIDRAGSAFTRTVSGATLIDRAENATTESVSGAVTIREAAGNATAHTVSGGIAIWHSGPAPSTRTVSGRVHVTAVRPSR